MCGWQYDEEKGDPDEGLEPGTLWENIPDDWCCPDCGAGKEDFDMIEVEPNPTVLFDLHKITKNKKSDDFDYGQE